jgi:hypothetical protein
MGFISVGLISIDRVGYFDPISPPPMTLLCDPSLGDPSLCDWRLRYLSEAPERRRRLVTTLWANLRGGSGRVHEMFLPATGASATLL